MRVVGTAALGLLVASCGPPVVSQSTPAFIEVGGDWTRPSAELVGIAQTHCEKFGRHARQQTVREAMVNGGGGRWITYDCVP